MGVSPHTRQALIRAQSEQRTRLREMQARGAFGGPGVPDDAAPGDGLLEEFRRTMGIVRWLEMKFAEKWEDGELPDLVEVVGSEASKVKMETLFGGWWVIYQQERQHLVRTSKLCLDAGIEERQVRMAEQQAEVVYRMIQSAFDRMDLTDTQKNAIPQIMQALIRETTIPGELA